MLDDQQLLRRYATDGSETAFGELVARYVNLVYSAAFRRTEGDPHLAKDVTQMVFTDLARKARSLPKDVVLAGWLHRATHYAAAQARRTERRRVAREQEAVAMNTLQCEPSPDWHQIRPMLDEALDELAPAGRDALVLRFFEQRNLAEVGHALGSNEDAARKRVARALEKLRTRLIRRGVTTSATALSAVISVNAVQAAPVGLAATLAGASLAAAAAGANATLTVLSIVNMTKLQLSIISTVVVVGVTTPLVIQHQAQVKLRQKDEALQQRAEQLAQLTADKERLSALLAQANGAPTLGLPAPPAQVPSSPADMAQDTPTNLLARILSGETTPLLTREQAEAFLDENHRSAASLLAAYRTSRDSAWLEEAMQKYPDDPQVAFEAAFKKDASPEDRRRWLDAFKQSAPENPLANYLSALDHFKSGRTDQAVEELNAASGKQQFEDYTVHRWHADEEAYRSAGYSEAETTMAATWGLLLPQLAELRDMGRKIVDLANSYRLAGDETSAQAALQMAINMGEHFDGSKGTAGVPLITQLVGIAIERNALQAMDPASPYGDGGQTVQHRLDQLAQRSQTIKDGAKQVESLQQLMTPQDWITYNTRTRTFGEEAAAQWLVNKYGKR